ncbi:MAG: high-affinity branched-chain amino acid ABC transporter permease LivM [Magnetococcus sp. DMHC-6]
MLRTLTNALRRGGVALLLFIPITGVLLNGYDFAFNWQRPFGLAGLVFVVFFIFSVLKEKWPVGLHVTFNFTKIDTLFWVFVPIFVLALPFFLNKYWLNVAILALIYVLLGLGLNIVVGLAGLLDLGFVAFYAVGAYSYALGHLYLDLNFWAAIPFGALLAALFGMVLGFPVLRLHGDYLAIVTLGFGEIIRLVLNNWGQFTGGPNGLQTPFPTFFGLEFSRQAREGEILFHHYFNLAYSPIHRYLFIYLVLLLVVAGMVFFVGRLKKMPLGRSWEALRQDEIACRSLGINHVTVKLSAFAMGAMVGGMGGVFFAASQGFVNPASFTFFESALILAIVVLGGMGSIRGVISAALALTILPELLRDFADFRVLIFGLAMVGMMVWRPKGLLNSRRRFFSLEST